MAVTDERVSRGKLLKRAGIGAAALGAGSMLTAATAGAAAPASKSCISAGGCGQFQSCQSHDCCGCIVTVEGCCFCMQDVYCAGLTACTSSLQCPPGWNCATGGCGATATHGWCVPACGYHGPQVFPCIEGPVPAGTGASFSGR